MDGGGRVEQLTGQLHELNMQLSQLKELNSQLEAQHSTAVEEVDTSHKQIYKAAAFTFMANVAVEISFQDQFKHIVFKDHILNISFHICPSFVTCIS